MKKLFILCAAALACACTTTKEPSYTVSVTLQGDSTQFLSDTLLLTNYQQDADLIQQKVAIVNGKAEFKGAVETPEYYYLAFQGSRPFARLFLENDVFTVNCDLADPRAAEIKGGKTQQVMDSLAKAQDAIYQAYNTDSLMRVYRAAETSAETRAQIAAIFDSLNTAAKGVGEAYVKANPTSLYALNKIAENFDYLATSEAEEAIKPFVDDTVNFKNNKTVAKLMDNILKAKALEPGQKAPEFEQAAPNGEMIKLSDVCAKNKVTLVDFWASWCGPCRAFNPELVKIYSKYHKKGFEILAVSFDDNKEKWEKAIKDDKLTWLHVSDLQGWKNAVGVPYMVKYIPQNILVDANGIIIKRRASKEDLESILSDMLK